LQKLNPAFGRRLNILMASLTAPASSPAFYEKAFRKQHNVITFGPHRDQTFWEAHAAGFRSHEFYREGTCEHWLDLCIRTAKACDIITPRASVELREIKPRLPSDFKPDLFIWIDQHGWNVPVNLQTLECPTVAVFGDTHMRENWDLWLKYALTYDFVFVSYNRQHHQRFRDAGCKRVFWSPAACDPEIHCKISAEKIFPVSFVGGTYRPLHRDRVELIEFLRSHGVDIYVDAKLFQEMSLIFSQSKIVLNKSMADDLNMRVFEAMATGSLLLTNRLPLESGQEELFVDRKHLVLYDRAEILELIDFYLKHEIEREAIAAAGYNEVIQKHTYDDRVRDILQDVSSPC